MLAKWLLAMVAVEQEQQTFLLRVKRGPGIHTAQAGGFSCKRMWQRLPVRPAAPDRGPAVSWMRRRTWLAD